MIGVLVGNADSAAEIKNTQLWVKLSQLNLFPPRQLLQSPSHPLQTPFHQSTRAQKFGDCFGINVIPREK